MNIMPTSAYVPQDQKRKGQTAREAAGRGGAADAPGLPRRIGPAGRGLLAELARELDKIHPGAAASLREGMAETLTILRLGAPTRKGLAWMRQPSSAVSPTCFTALALREPTARPLAA